MGCINNFDYFDITKQDKRSFRALGMKINLNTFSTIKFTFMSGFKEIVYVKCNDW